MPDPVKVPEAIYVCPACGEVGTVIPGSSGPTCAGSSFFHTTHRREAMVRVPVRPAADGDRLADAVEAIAGEAERGHYRRHDPVVVLGHITTIAYAALADYRKRTRDE